MEVVIDRLNHSGEGIGFLNGKVVFVPRTMPGDIVDIKIEKEYKNYSKGTVISYKSLSQDREKVLCPFYNTCGGCQIMHIPYEKSLEYKKKKVIDIIKKYADIEVNPTIKESDNYYYRNKITLQVVGGNIGLYDINSNNLTEVDKCLLVDEEINKVIKVLKESSLNLIEINKIVIRCSSNEVMVKFIGKIEESSLIKELSPFVASLYLNDKHIYGKQTITDTLGKYKFLISPDSFFQVNHNQTINLYDQVKSYLGKESGNVLDLYCGTGTIGIYVSDYCDKVLGIELNNSSVKDAISNIKLNNLTNVKVLQGDVGKVIDSNSFYDAIIVDPPRSGLDNATKEALLKIKSPKIIYISCDPITLARDLKCLKELYDVKDITLFDMFPNTYHVETVVLLSKGEVDSKKIRVEFSLEDMDMSEFQDGATYPQIKAYVLEHSGLKVSNLYISQIKRKCGIEVGKNYNLPKSEDSRQPQCPPEKEKAIREAFKYFGMI